VIECEVEAQPVSHLASVFAGDKSRRDLECLAVSRCNELDSPPKAECNLPEPSHWITHICVCMVGVQRTCPSERVNTEGHHHVT
jgi:hypothetical protein